VRVFESGAILVYLAEKFGKLLPKAPAERAEVLSWTFWQIGGLGPMVGQWGFFARMEEKNEPALKRYFDESVRLYEVLDQRLKGREYLAGEYSIADIACYPWAKGGLKNMAGEHPELAKRFPAVNDWIERIDPRPAVKKGMSIPAK
jgi:GST-like protein